MVPRAVGQKAPVEVTFHFLQVGCPVIEVSDRYSAVKLTAALPEFGQLQT
jgi:hypothetical protein